MVDVNLPVIGMGILSALAYALYGILRAKSNGDSVTLSRVLPVVVAAVFLAIVAPELIPANPDSVFLLPMIALTAFSTFGAFFVIQRLYDVGLAVLNYLRDLFDNAQAKLTYDEDVDSAMRPKVRARKPKPKASVPKLSTGL